MSKRQSGSSVQKLVWRIILTTLIVGIILIVASKLLPSVLEQLTARWEEFMEYLEGFMIV